MCFPSSSSLPLTAAVVIRTFFLHFKAPRRLMSYPEIMKGETLLGFETGAEHASSSQFSHFPLSSSRVQGTSQHFHLGGSGTGLRTSRSFDSTRCFPFFLFMSQEENPRSPLFGPLKRCTSHFCPKCAAIFPSNTSRSSWLLSSACILEQSIKALFVSFSFLLFYLSSLVSRSLLLSLCIFSMALGPPPHL